MNKIFNFLFFFITFKFCLNTFCDDGLECPDNFTCCKGPLRYSCCPLENAVCCEDGYHCCPKNYTCNAKEHKCDKINEKFKILESVNLYELTPTSMIYKKGWNELYENCAADIKLIKSDLTKLFFDMLTGKNFFFHRAKEDFYKLIEDGKITKKDCIKFLKEVFE